MAATMKWPPVPENGRIPMVRGAEATTIVVVQTLSDLGQNPFNAKISLGDITFRAGSGARARIEEALKRLARSISIESIVENVASEGSARYTISFVDRETRQRVSTTV